MYALRESRAGGIAACCRLLLGQPFVCQQFWGHWRGETLLEVSHRVCSALHAVLELLLSYVAQIG